MLIPLINLKNLGLLERLELQELIPFCGVNVRGSSTALRDPAQPVDHALRHLVDAADLRLQLLAGRWLVDLQLQLLGFRQEFLVRVGVEHRLAQRRQFDRPISDFQAIRFKIAEMATQIEAARQLNYFVCEQIDTGQRCDKEASMVKLFASEMAERVTSEALQVFGGAGYTTLHAVERYWRDARLTKIFEGTSEIQQRIISDHLLGKQKAA